MRWSKFDSDSDWIYFSIWIITFPTESHIWWFNMIQKEDFGLQLLCWSLFLILSFDKWYSAINTPTNYSSELYIHIKSSLEIRRGFKFRNNQLSLSSYSSTLCISPINTYNLKGKEKDHAEIDFRPVFYSF